MEIKNGTATLQNAKGWKQQLKKGITETKQFLDSMENLARVQIEDPNFMRA